MAKVEVLIAGRRYTLQSDATADAMMEVVAELQQRVNKTSQSARQLGSTEQLVLAFLDTLAELQTLRQLPPEETPEIAALISRLTYLEGVLAYAEQSKELRRRKRKNRSTSQEAEAVHRKQKQEDFAETQLSFLD